MVGGNRGRLGLFQDLIYIIPELLQLSFEFGVFLFLSQSLVEGSACGSSQEQD
jgi:hypothetical protein